MRRAACPGSFDPVTLGHLDIIGRAAALYDEVVVAVGLNASKNRMFSFEERTEMLREATARYGNVSVDSFDGLIVDFCKSRDIPVIVKGLRAVSDFDYELQMAQMNSSLTDVETVFVPTSPEWSFLASSLVKEVAMFGGDVSSLIPGFVHEALVARLAAAFVVIGIAVGVIFRLSGVYWAAQIAIWILLALGGLIVPALAGATG